jgi:hypothetical protein
MNAPLITASAAGTRRISPIEPIPPRPMPPIRARRHRRALGRPRRLQVTDDAALLPTTPRTQS